MLLKHGEAGLRCTRRSVPTDVPTDVPAGVPTRRDAGGILTSTPSAVRR